VLARSLSAGEVVVGCVTENSSKYLGQALRLVQSIRWFGGALADARVVVAAVERLDLRARRELERYGADVRLVPRVHRGNPSSNRLWIFDELRRCDEAHFLVLDCDTIVVRDPLPHLRRDVFHSKIAPFSTVTDEVFVRLFAHFGLPMPARSHLTGYGGTPTIPYFNAGVVSMPAAIADRLVPEWRRFNALLNEDPTLAAPCEKHIHQAALALALAASNVPVAEMGAELNYQLNATDVVAPPGYAAIDPIIIHYHHLAGDDGLLLPTPFPAAQARIDAFNDRVVADRKRATPVRVRASAPPEAAKRIVVIGMHRSGTSVLARLLNAMGCWAGEDGELAPPDIFNPTGYWERRDVLALDHDILDALGASWLEPARVDLNRLSDESRRSFVERARAIAGSLDARGAWMIKDPRLAILFPIWREALGDASCVLIWREPAAVARSLAERDDLPLLLGLALWEEYTRAMLDATIGLPRVCVAYEELLRDPRRVAATLRDALGLRMPDDDELDAIVDPQLNRHAVDDALLNRAQSELRDALRSGAALAWANVPPTHPDTRRCLAEFLEHWRSNSGLRKSVERRGLLLDAVFSSRSWRLGFALTRLWRRLARSAEPTALDRWAAERRRARM